MPYDYKNVDSVKIYICLCYVLFFFVKQEVVYHSNNCIQCSQDLFRHRCKDTILHDTAVVMSQLLDNRTLPLPFIEITSQLEW